MASVATRSQMPQPSKGKAPERGAPASAPAPFPFDEALNDLMQLIPREGAPESPTPPSTPASKEDDMLAKIIHQTVHTTKPPPNSSLTDEQLQQITQLKPPASSVPLTPESKEPKVTLWDTQQRCRISGAAAPGPRDLDAYLRAHPHMQVYSNQDAAPAPAPPRSETGSSLPAAQAVRVTVWDSLQQKKLTGAEAPTEKELVGFLQRHPHCEIFCGQTPRTAPSAEPASEPTKTAFKWVDKPLAGKWDEPIKPRAADLTPKRPPEPPAPDALAKRARLEAAPAAAPPAAAPAAAPAALPSPAAAAPAPAVVAPAAAPAPAAPAPDGPGVVFVPLVVSSFSAVSTQLQAYLQSPALRRSLAALAAPGEGEKPLQMPMPFLPLAALGAKAAAPAPAAVAGGDESDALLSSLLDAAGADQGLSGGDASLCISSLFDDSECAALGAALSEPPARPSAHRHAAHQHHRPMGAPAAAPQRALSRAAPGRGPAPAGYPVAGRGPALTVPPANFTSGECGYPYCENKGWFAFNEAGKGIFLLERLFLMLSMPQQPLAKHHGRRMRDAIRWMDRATADAHGVPEGAVGFELVDAMLFSDEVYPQWRSGSFRKTAKHWGLTSPKPKQHSVRKLTPKCMYLPVFDEPDQPAVDLEGVFKPLPPGAGLQGLADYVKTQIRPLEESIKAKAASGTPRAVAAAANAANAAAAAAAAADFMEVDAVPITVPMPHAHRAAPAAASHAPAAAPSAAADQSQGLKWHCSTLA